MFVFMFDSVHQRVFSYVLVCVSLAIVFFSIIFKSGKVCGNSYTWVNYHSSLRGYTRFNSRLTCLFGSCLLQVHYFIASVGGIYLVQLCESLSCKPMRALGQVCTGVIRGRFSFIYIFFSSFDVIN